MEWPGYGICTEAKSSAEQVNKHAAAAFQFAQEALGWPRERIILMGCCLGVGPAMSLAATTEVAGLVLVSSFLSVRTAFATRLGASLCRFVAELFPNDVLAPRV